MGGVLVYLGSGKPARLANYYSLSQDGVSRTADDVICDAHREHSHQRDMFTALQKLGQPFTFELYSVQGDVQLPSSVPVAYPAAAGEPHAACKAEHLILHQVGGRVGSSEPHCFSSVQLITLGAEVLSRWRYRHIPGMHFQ